MLRRSLRVASRRPPMGVRSLGFLNSPTPKPPKVQKSSIFGAFAFGIGALGVGIYCFDARSAINEYVFCPLIRLFTDGEDGHRLGIWFMKNGLSPRVFFDRDDDILKVNVFGKTLSNPLGVAAGLDKNGEVIDPLLDLGFGYVEIGSITPKPQPGNPKPRFFRLNRDDAVINRYGFNSDGHFQVLATLRTRLEKFWTKSKEEPYSNAFRNNKVLAINLGKNKTGDEIEDYVLGVQRLGPYADVLVINVSSPNTPGLRNLQSENKLTNLLKTVVKERDQISEIINNQKPPVMVKVAPDLTETEIESIANSAKEAKIDGIIMSNTTIQRPKTLLSDSQFTKQTGGLSGKPLKPISLKAFRILRKYTKDSDLVLVGCGGISSGKDAIEFAKAGATFVQLYTSFAYKGPGLASKIKDEIVQELKKENKTWMEIIGSDD